jgi:hypothetical protein
MMILLYLSTYSKKSTPLQIQANRPLGCFAQQLLKNPNSKDGYPLPVLYSRGQGDKRYGQIVSSPYSSENNNVSVSDLYIPTIHLPILLQVIWDRSWKYISRSHTYKCGNWDGGRAIPRKGIYKWDFRCSVVYSGQDVLYSE